MKSAAARGARQVRHVAVGVARRVDAGDFNVADRDDLAVRDGARLALHVIALAADDGNAGNLLLHLVVAAGVVKVVVR